MGSYDFDSIIDRRNTSAIKFDGCKEIYGTNDLLPMWIADMDFAVPEYIISALKKRLEHPIFGYTQFSDGYYNSIINWVSRRHQWNIQRDWIFFSPGVVTGLACIVNTFTKPGDGVIVHTPVYHPFYYVIENQGRKIVRTPLKLENDKYVMDFDLLEKNMKEGAKLMFICNPHNPIGRCWNREELETLGNLAVKYNCLIVSDAIHSDMTMPNFKYTSLASISEVFAQQTITCMSPSKTFNLAGISTSAIIIPNEELRRKFAHVVIEGLHIQNGNTLGNIALEAAYTHGDQWVDELRNYLYNNLLFMQEFLSKELPEVKIHPHEATYMIWLNFQKYGLTHEQLWQKLISKGKLALNDGKIFGAEGDNCMRLNFACPRIVLEDAMVRLKQTLLS